MILRIGTRGSKLALSQSHWVKDRIEAAHPGVRVELVRIKTTGDRILDSPLSKIGGKGLFVKEIEDALMGERVDLAVHSIKDVPAKLPQGLTLSSFPRREDPADALISRGGQTLDRLPQGARVGTSSLRRGAQLLHVRPDLRLASLRGNVDTRLRRLESGDIDAVILAVAGLKRLDLYHRATQALGFDQVLPAVGQGALGVETRRDDRRILSLIRFLDHGPTRTAVTAERAFLNRLEGGCQVPIAGLARLEGERLILEGMVAELDGSEILRDRVTGPADHAEELGINLAGKLLHMGAGRILERVYGKGLG